MSELDSFLKDLSSDAPVPGGGSAAALQVAIAAALLAMVAALTLGRRRYAEVEVEAGRIRGRALGLMDEASTLERQDREVYSHVSQAMALPRESEPEKAERAGQIQEALKEAAQPPLRTMQCAAEVIQLARRLTEIGNRSAISDVGCAALAAVAGFEGAKLNVEINLAAVRDESWVRQMREQMKDIDSPGSYAEDIGAQVMAVIKGEVT